jgi:Uma2 family endonuclease
MSTIAQDRTERYKQYRELIVGDIAIRHVIPRMEEEEFFEFCQHNKDLRIEQDKHGNIHIMSPVSLDSGNLENQIITDLTNWNRTTKLGRTYSSSTLFILPDGEKRMPDAAWISELKIQKLSLAERRSFAHLVPDFIVELKSPTDNPADLDRKIREAWIANGVRMAWYIDPDAQICKIYLADGSIEVISGFDKVLSGGDVLPGFVFQLSILLS